MLSCLQFHGIDHRSAVFGGDISIGGIGFVVFGGFFSGHPWSISKWRKIDSGSPQRLHTQHPSSYSFPSPTYTQILPLKVFKAGGKQLKDPFGGEFW
jgi:hypothetical protein